MNIVSKHKDVVIKYKCFWSIIIKIKRNKNIVTRFNFLNKITVYFYLFSFSRQHFEKRQHLFSLTLFCVTVFGRLKFFGSGAYNPWGNINIGALPQFSSLSSLLKCPPSLLHLFHNHEVLYFKPFFFFSWSYHILNYLFLISLIVIKLFSLM